MWLSSLVEALKRLGHRLFLAYAHFRWRRWRRPWRYREGRWFVVVRDEDMDKEKVRVITWCRPETRDVESICLPLPDCDYSDYVPLEDRIPRSRYFPLIYGFPDPFRPEDDSSEKSDLSSAHEQKTARD